MTTRARVKSFRIITQIIFFVILMSAVQCQRRIFSRRRHHHRPPLMPLPPLFPPSSPVWPQHQINERQYPDYSNYNQIAQREERTPESDCPYVHIKKITTDGLYGMISFKNQFETENVTIELEFDENILAFVNDFSHSTSIDSKNFIIFDKSRKLKQFEEIKINFYAKFIDQNQPSLISRIKFNNQLLCPDEMDESGCARFELLTNGTGGRWDGVLTISPQWKNSEMKIQLEFDEFSFALGNDFGHSITHDQFHYTITGYRPFNSNHPLTINLFLLYNELDEIPNLKEIKVNGHHVCLPDNLEESNSYSMMPPAFNRSMHDMFLLTDLPLDAFMNVTLSPELVTNENFQCNDTSNILRTRVNGDITAKAGQFPFHVAIFYDQRYRCGGSLVTEKATITASHCVVDSTQKLLSFDKFRLLFGSVDLLNLKGNEAVREVEEIFKHQNYEFDRILKMDIAIVKIRGNLQFSVFIRPICLPDSLPSITTQIDENLLILGFGSSTESLQPSRFLHYGSMMVISRTQCTEKLIFALLPEQSTFCAKANDNVLACPGDSGGGIVENINGTFYLRGIASVTITEISGRCNVENPVGFTNVKSFISWIRDKI